MSKPIIETSAWQERKTSMNKKMILALTMGGLLAGNGHADLIVTGDTDLLVLNPFRGILIVPPATFVQTMVR